MKVSRPPIRAIVRKELREYRRNRSIVVGMAIIPMIFLIQPLVSVFAAPASAAADLGHKHELLYLLAIPALVPATLAAYAIAGERQQATLEPMLGTPIRREELLLGKALAVLLPSIVVSYLVYVIFIVCVVLFAAEGIPAALIRGPDVLIQLVFTPLLAAWSIWVSIAFSTRASDVRVAQQLSALASVPTIAVTTLIAVDVIHATRALAIFLAVGLVVANRVGWRVVSAMFDRERLITGVR
jgi:ABC-type transport system involved in multi-copper enzyme maturation permease subunit